MTEKSKQNMKSWVSTWLTPSLIIGAIVTGAWLGGQMKADANTRMFENAQQRQKTKAHIDSDYNEVKNYQLMEQVSKMKVELDTSYAFVNAMFKEDRAARIADSLNSINAILSRKRRDSLSIIQNKRIDKIEREATIQSNAVQLTLSKVDKILRKLDTIN